MVNHSRFRPVVATFAMAVVVLAGWRAVQNAEQVLDLKARLPIGEVFDTERGMALQMFLHQPTTQAELDDHFQKYVVAQIKRQQEDTVGLHRRSKSDLRNTLIEERQNLEDAVDLAKQRKTGIVVVTTLTGNFLTTNAVIALALKSLDVDSSMLMQSQGLGIDLLHGYSLHPYGNVILYPKDSPEKRDRQIDRRIPKRNQALFLDGDVSIQKPVDASVDFYGVEVFIDDGVERATKNGQIVVVVGATSDGVHVSKFIDSKAFSPAQLRQEVANEIAAAWQRAPTVVHNWGAPAAYGKELAKQEGLHLF